MCMTHSPGPYLLPCILQPPVLLVCWSHVLVSPCVPPMVACGSFWVDICMLQSLGCYSRPLNLGTSFHPPSTALLCHVECGREWDTGLGASGFSPASLQLLHRCLRPGLAPHLAISNLEGWILAVVWCPQEASTERRSVSLLPALGELSTRLLCTESLPHLSHLPWCVRSSSSPWDFDPKKQ